MQISLILIRLAAIFFFMSAVQYFPATAAAYWGAPDSYSVRLDLLVVSLNIFICAVIFGYPRTVLIGLTGIFAGSDADKSSIETLQSVGIAVIGLYFAMSGLQDLVYYHILLWQRSVHELGYQPASPLEMAGYWTAAFELFCGLVLIAMSGKVSALLSWLRELRPRGDEKENID